MDHWGRLHQEQGEIPECPLRLGDRVEVKGGFFGIIVAISFRKYYLFNVLCWEVYPPGDITTGRSRVLYDVPEGHLNPILPPRPAWPRLDPLAGRMTSTVIRDEVELPVQQIPRKWLDDMGGRTLGELLEEHLLVRFEGPSVATSPRTPVQKMADKAEEGARERAERTKTLEAEMAKVTMK